MSDQLFNALPPSLLYISLFLFFFGFVGAQLSQASEGFARAFGPLGRYWRRKVAEEQKARLDIFHEQAKDAVASELGIARRAEYNSLKVQLFDVLDRLAEFERSEAVAEAYLIADAEWHRIVNIRLAESGTLSGPLPDRVPYFEFEDKYRAARGWVKKER